MTLSRLTVGGAPYERGYAHGEQLAAEIRTNIDVYDAQYEYRGVDRDAARDDATRFVSLIEDLNEAYAAEMRGIADGSDLDLCEVALLNVRYEVMYSAYSDEAEELATAPDRGDLTDGCTSFGVLPSHTADGHTYVGENWDWKPDLELAVVQGRPDEGPAYLGLTEAGIVSAKIGLNEHGVGLAINGLVTDADGDDPFRKPFHVRCAEILGASHFDDALRPVLTTDRPCSANFLLGHADGELLNVEAAPSTANYLYPDDGIITHANHFEVRTHALSTNERRSPNTLFRGERLRRALETASPIEFDDLATGLSDHFSRPMSICRHEDEMVEPVARSRTNASVVLDLTDRVMYVTDGPPCESDYERVALGDEEPSD